jgi:3-phosphoshikimate 1-carboxyvinyltransferase
LLEWGAQISSADGKPPLRIHGGSLQGIKYGIPVASAQVKSAVLFGGLYADTPTTVVERTPTRDHSERLLKWFGANVKNEDTKITLTPGRPLGARDVRIPGDVSSAAFFVTAGAAIPGSDLTVDDIGLNPTRTAYIDLLRSFGADIEIINRTDNSNEPVGSVRVRGKSPLGARLVIDGRMIANLIDEIPVLAILGTKLTHGIEIHDAAELRVKESDRIRALTENLRKMGAAVEEFEDGLRVEKSELHGAIIDPHGDHRIAMAFAVAGLFASGETQISDPRCVDISFPGFFEMLSSVARR